MEHFKKQHIGDTVRIRRPPKVFTDVVGRTVWMSDVEPCELELRDEPAIDTNPYDRTGAWLTG
ncbi:MAG: hypothetical protein QNJ11_10340 [Woeseiaceae bacterium]|nr:hypothetical protein [Woeseiaceae bacterium]